MKAKILKTDAETSRDLVQASPSIMSPKPPLKYPAEARSRSQLSGNTTLTAKNLKSSFNRNLDLADERHTIVGIPLHIKKAIANQKKLEI